MTADCAASPGLRHRVVAELGRHLDSAAGQLTEIAAAGKRYEDWVLDDPAGQDLNHVRPIRDQIRRRVESLIDQLLPS
jgi:protein-tyrosine-phosphatase